MTLQSHPRLVAGSATGPVVLPGLLPKCNSGPLETWSKRRRQHNARSLGRPCPPQGWIGRIVWGERLSAPASACDSCTSYVRRKSTFATRGGVDFPGVVMEPFCASYRLGMCARPVARKSQLHHVRVADLPTSAEAISNTMPRASVWWCDIGKFSHRTREPTLAHILVWAHDERHRVSCRSRIHS